MSREKAKNSYIIFKAKENTYCKEAHTVHAFSSKTQEFLLHNSQKKIPINKIENVKICPVFSSNIHNIDLFIMIQNKKSVQTERSFCIYKRALKTE